MPYATVADLETLNSNRTFATVGKPNLTDVTEFLHQTGAVIDSILQAQGYQLPIPAWASTAQGMLKLFNSYGGYALSERAAPQSPFREEADKLWESAQRMLRNGDVTLDAPKVADTTRARGAFAPTAMFTRDQEL